MANDVERDVNRYKRELKKIENQTSRIKTHKEDVKSKLVEKIEQELIYIKNAKDEFQFRWSNYLTQIYRTIEIGMNHQILSQ